MAMFTMSTFRTALEIYEYLCRPVREEAGIQQKELDILLFLANHPEKDTAGDVHRMGGMKQSMVSILVEKLVQAGYLERQAVPGDRRKVKLLCTEKAAPVVEQGREAQARFRCRMTEGLSPEELAAYERVVATMGQNLMRCRELMLKGELK